MHGLQKSNSLACSVTISPLHTLLQPHLTALSLDSQFAVAVPSKWNTFWYAPPHPIIQASPVWTPVTEHSLSSNSRALVAQKGSSGASLSGCKPWLHPPCRYLGVNSQFPNTVRTILEHLTGLLRRLDELYL